MEASSSRARFFKLSQSDLWVVLGAIGLILAGMLLGAGIMRFWMSHPSPVSSHTLMVVLLRILEKALL